MGWAGFSINYRLGGFPVEVGDVLSAVDWLRAHSAKYHVDPNNLALLGTSSGGNLVALAASDAAAFGGSSAGIRAVVTWSGPMDLATLVTGNEPPQIVDLVAHYLGCGETECPARYAQASPITSAGARSPPMLLVNSTDEVIPLSQAYSMAAKLHSAGVSAPVDAIPGRLHAAAYAHVAFPASVNYLSGYLGPISGTLPPVTANSEGLGQGNRTTQNPGATSATPTKSVPHWLPVLLVVLGGALVVSAVGRAVSRRRRRN